MKALEAAGVRTNRIAPNDPMFDSFVSDLDPHVVLFDRFTLEEMFGWRVFAHAPNALRILDTQDLHFLRHQRQQRRLIEVRLECE